MTTVESQLVVHGRAVTRGSTPKATLFEIALFRKFVANPLLTEVYGEVVASGFTESEKDSNFDMRRQHLEPNHDGPHDGHHLADQPAPDIQEAILFLPRVESGPDTVKEIEVRRIARVMD